MGLVMDTHKHMIGQGDAKRKYFPWQQTWHQSLNWAYGAVAPNRGMPPFERDPSILYPKMMSRLDDPEGEWTLKDMDDAGVDASLLLPIDYDFSWGSASDITIEEKHEHLSYIQEKYPGRYFGLAGPDPRRPGAVDIFNRGIKNLKLNGLKMIPKMGFYVWDEKAYQLFERCLEYDVPAFVCTQPEGGGYNRVRFTDPIHLDDVIGDFPDMKLVCLHAGAPLYDYLEHALLVCARGNNTAISLDMWLWGFEMLVPNFIPNIMTGEEAVVTMLARARDTLGAHRIMWGTDTFSGPRVNGRNVFGHATGFGMTELVDWLRRLPETAAKYGKSFTKEEVDLILGENASRFLGIKEYPEWKRPHRYEYSRRMPPPFRGM